MARIRNQSHNSRLGEHLEQNAGLIMGLLSAGMLLGLLFLEVARVR